MFLNKIGVTLFNDFKGLHYRRDVLVGLMLLKRPESTPGLGAVLHNLTWQ